MLKFTERPTTPGMTSKKHWKDKHFAGYLVLSGSNKGWYGSIYKDMELEMDCLTSKRVFQQICSYKCQFCLKVWASSTAGPSGSYDGWEKCKEKVPVSDPNQNAETTCNFKLKST